MAFTYNIAVNAGKVRMIIPDRTATAYFFEDDEIDALLVMEGGVVKKAAALALETIAADEAYVQKLIKLMDLTTNGPATAEALLKRAALLREQAAEEEAASTDVAEFDWSEWVLDDFSGRERVEKEALRARL